jgi:hypothetical protein
MRANGVCVAVLIAATVPLSACNGADNKPSPGTGAPPAAASVAVDLRTAQPTYPRGTAPKIDMVLRNDGSQPCKLPSAATGAIEVTSVIRDGQAVIGKGGTDDYYNGLSAVVASSLRSVAPGESLTVPLDIETAPNGPPTLVISIQTPSDRGRSTSWTLDQPGQYRITARPARVTGVTDICAVPSATSTVEFGVQP